MKDWQIWLFVGAFMIFIGFVLFYTSNKHFDKEIVQIDTVVITAPDYSLMKQNDSLCNVIDSLSVLNAKYEEELNIALFKLERIKDYNRIAANGNNIKYLRGWINRVINE